jgi:hypothetical protein
MWNPNKAKHKAMHGGYRKKPTKTEVKANLNFFSELNIKVNNSETQLKKYLRD